MTLKVTQGHQNCHYSIGHISLAICSNNISILHFFLRYNHFYRIRDGLWPWNVLQFQEDDWNCWPCTCVLQYTCKHIIANTRAVFPEVRELQTFQTAKVTFKVTQGPLLLVPFDKPRMISYYSSILTGVCLFVRCTVSEILRIYQCLSKYLWPPYVIGQAIIFLPCGFFFFYLFLLA